MRDVNLLMTAIVRATPSACTQAILDEVEGRSQWWRPYLLLRHRPATPHDGPGCTVDVLANPRGRTDRLLGTTRWTLRLSALEPGKALRWDFVEGHYRGWMTWALEPMDPGTTRISVRGELRPTGWNRVRSAFWDEIYEVTGLLRHGFDGMERHLAASSPAPSPAQRSR